MFPEVTQSMKARNIDLRIERISFSM